MVATAGQSAVDGDHVLNSLDRKTCTTPCRHCHQHAIATYGSRTAPQHFSSVYVIKQLRN